MANPVFLRIALPTPLRRLFDYLPPQGIDLQGLTPGVRVRVPFQSRHLVGVLIEVATSSSVPYGKLKKAEEILDVEPIFPSDVDGLCQWAADYYHYALGEVLSSAMPALLRKGEPLSVKPKALRDAASVDVLPVLNEAQHQAVQQICSVQDEFRAFLLDGVTGSGKTEVYLRAIADKLAAGKQVLVLVPEISLTPQTIERFRSRFAVPIVALHSNLSETERLRAWLLARSGEVKIVIGTRSAVFTPFAALGLIVVDEEHDASFKQQDRFRYHARDMAVKRASLNRISIVLGSATPSLESLLNVKRERYMPLFLPQRAGGAALPECRMIDLRGVAVEEGISAPLLIAMREQLDQGNQVLLFLNRRGYAPVLYCPACTWMAGCRRCDARLVYHSKPARLQCHHCDSRRSLPERCEQCGEANLQPVGLGTQRLETWLQQQFAGIPLLRVDRDSTRKKGAMDDILAQIHSQPRAILLGTQMLAKGHHFPHVTLVGVVDADSGLFSADFRAAEHMGQLLLQVSGRAGRAEKPGTVLIQTKHPDHPLLQTLIHQGYQAFSQTLLAEREQALLPPFVYFAVMKAEAHGEANANRFLTMVKELCQAATSPVSVVGPMEAPMAKRKGLYCQQLLIKATQRGVLQSFLGAMLKQMESLSVMPSVRWVLDVDPLEV